MYREAAADRDILEKVHIPTTERYGSEIWTDFQEPSLPTGSFSKNGINKELPSQDMNIQNFFHFLYTTWHSECEEPLSSRLVEAPV